MTSMDDEKIRRLLGRYRPAGPPDGLRERALAHGVRDGRTWPWAAAAAALVAATVGLQVAASRANGRVAQPAALDAEALAAALGGDEEARQAVQLLMDEQAYRAWLVGGESTGTTEDGLNEVD